MSARRNGQHLEFPCECVSARRGYSDPWAEITQRKLLGSSTKERVLNSVARQPKTIAHLAKELGVSQPTIHTHVNEMLTSELLRESTAWEKRHPLENYYEPNFPIVRAVDRAAFEQICEEMAARMADVFQTRQSDLEHAVENTVLPQQGWDFAAIAQYCFTSAQRGARRLLEERGVLPERQTHKNGAAWLFWAEESQPLPQPASDRTTQSSGAALTAARSARARNR